MKDLLNGYKQRFPCLIEIEPTEGCNLGCSFCGLKGIREKGTKPWKFMTVETARIVARKIKEEEDWRSRISFCGHGEPTLNPNLLEIIKVFREELPNQKQHSFSLITNGAGFRNGNFEINSFCEELEKLGFNNLIFDVYSDNGDWNAIGDLEDGKYEISILENDSFSSSNNKKFKIVLYPLKMEKHGVLRKMQNHCGAAAPLDYKREHTVCTKVFRELFIRWDGNVALCCDDFRGQYQIANVLDENLSLSDIWNHERFQAARIRLFNKDRTFLPCHGCDCPPNKAGFIPDITGGKDKKFMPTEISDDVIRITKEAYHKEGLTTIVKRKWEL